MSNPSMPEEIRETVYRHGDTHVDVKFRVAGRFAVVRAWEGARWPKVRRTWRGRLRGWLPWFSLERQIVRAIEYVNDLNDVYQPRPAIRESLRPFVQGLKRTDA